MTQKGEMLGKMISLAVERHAGQFDKGGRPYILHCLTVMHRLRTDDEELQCIAVGHDLLEDTNVSMAELQDLGFSNRVVMGIDALTKYSDDDADYRFAVKSNPDAIRVKMEDLRHNSDIRRLKGVRPKDIERVAKYHEFYLELEQALASMSRSSENVTLRPDIVEVATLRTAAEVEAQRLARKALALTGKESPYA